MRSRPIAKPSRIMSAAERQSDGVRGLLSPLFKRFVIRRAGMGQFHFDVPDVANDFIKRSLWKDAYICGIEGVPWQSRNHFDGSRLTITRGIESSGKLYIACPLEGIGYRTLSTCSLRPQRPQRSSPTRIPWPARTAAIPSSLSTFRLLRRITRRFS